MFVIRSVDESASVSYSTDFPFAMCVLESVVISADSMLRDEPSNVFVSELQDSAIELGARIWVKNEDYWNTKWQLTEEIKTAFDKNNIEIPFPQMDVNIQKRSIDSDF